MVILAFKDLTVIKDWDYYIKPIYNDDDDNRK